MELMPVTDAVFLIGETRDNPTHVGGLQIFESPEGVGPGFARQVYESLLEVDELHPLYRKRPHRSAATLGQWTWVEDTDIDLEYHVRHSALPSPGRVRELLALGSRLHGTLLARERPLWEFHLIEGLEGGRFAAYTKIHHALVDGVSALRILERSLSPDPTAPVLPPWGQLPPRRPPVPEEAGDGADGGGARGAVAAAARTARDIAGVAPALVRALRRGLEEQLAVLPFQSPSSMLNVPITGARRFAADSWSFERVRRLKKAAGVSVNDVVLAMCAGALRRYLLDQDGLPDAPLTAMVPVSLRGEEGMGGNAVGAVLASLATDQADPAERLARIHASMDEAKASLRGLSPMQAMALSAAVMAPMSLLPLLVGRRAVRPPFNLVISNIPGPRTPLYWNGARLQGIYPMSVPFHGQALNITVTSYVDNLEFGLTGCRRSVPHLQRLLGDLEKALTELEEAVG